MMFGRQTGSLVRGLFLLTVFQFLDSVDGGACQDIAHKNPLKVYENVTAGTTLLSWPNDSVIVDNFNWVSENCREIFNVTSDKLLANIDFDLESPTPQSLSKTCGFSCKDESMPVGRPAYNWPLYKLYILPLNEFPPVFPTPTYYVNVTEMTPTGYVVFRTNQIGVTDKDKGDSINRYALGPVTDNAFIMANNQEGRIEVYSQLDYETGPKVYTTSLYAYDSQGQELTGTASLVITIEDVDDQSPAFSSLQYSLNVQEGNSGLVNTPMFTTPNLRAFDQDYGINSTVLYRLLPVAQSAPTALVHLYNKFAVDSGTGAISINDVLDREQIIDDGILQPITLHIQAYENTTSQRSNRTTVSVTVTDVNDNLPSFSSTTYTAEISEHPASGSILTYVSATDKDEGTNAAFDYKLLNGTEYFRVEGNQNGPGRIIVQNGTALDRETKPNIWIQVGTNTDTGMTNTAIIKVVLEDVNDNAPIFGETEYHFEIKSQNASSLAVVGDVLGKVSATDEDEGENGRVSYAFGSLGTDKYLSIDSTSGEIKIVRTPLPLEGEIATMEFFVQAADAGSPSLITVALVKVIHYGDDISFYLYANVAANLLERDKAALQSNMSTILGESVTIEQVVPDDTGGVDLSRSRLKLTAKYSNGTQLTREAVKSLTNEHYSDIQALFDAYKQTVTPGNGTTETTGITPAEIALIVIAVAVLITAIFVILIFCRMHHKIKRLARLGKIISKSSTIYESQEVKLEVMAETSDYDKSESLADEDVVENVEEGNPMTRWNPVFTDNDNVANISEVTELKKYFTYPRIRGSDESGFVGEDLQQRPDDPSDHGTSAENPYVNVSDEQDNPADDTSVKLPAVDSDENTPRITSPDGHQKEQDGEESFSESALNVEPEVSEANSSGEASAVWNAFTESDSAGSAPPNGHHGPGTPLLTLELVDPELPLPPPPASLMEDDNPIEDYDMNTESGSIPETIPESIDTDPSVTYAEVIRKQNPTEDYDIKVETCSLPPETVPESIASEPNPVYTKLAPLPEPKPDYTKVSFSDTAIAIDSDNKVEVIKQVLDDAVDEERSESDDDDDVSTQDASTSMDESAQVPLVSDTVQEEPLHDETPSTSGIPSDNSDSHTGKTILAKESETKPKVNGYVNVGFVSHEKPDIFHSQENEHFYFTEALTRF